jgi:glycerophosphoryl diester phosphodiesterase
MTGPWPYARTIAHRGGGSLAPENTLGAFEIGARYGYKMGEFDAKLSRDDVAFLLHDETVDRTSNGHGAAADLAYGEIARLDAGSWFDARFANERMPTLAELAQTVQRLGMDVNIEIKPSSGHEGRTGKHVAHEAALLWRGHTPPLLSSFSTDALFAAKAEAPELPRGLLLAQIRPDWMQHAKALECASIHVLHHSLDPSLIQQFKSADLWVMAYTVNDLARAQALVGWGVDAICTDRIDLIAPDAFGP